EHAAQLRAAAEWMREWCPPLVILWEKEVAGVTEETLAAIERAAQICDERVAEFRRIAEGNPRFAAKRNYGNMPARKVVHRLARLMYDSFGSWQYGSLATIASVALQQEISKQQVINWCHSLNDATSSPRGVIKDG